jgi:hypothetical protein
MTNTKVQSKKWFVLLAGVILASIAVASPTIHAQAAAPRTVPTPDGQKLEQFYDRLIRASGDQGKRLELSDKAAAAAQHWIDGLKAKGQDVSALESALSAFNAGIASAKGSHTTGAGILATHAGFDGAGNVTDLQLARATVETAAANLRQAHLTITQATMDFRNAVRAWRGQHGS